MRRLRNVRLKNGSARLSWNLAPRLELPTTPYVQPGIVLSRSGSRQLHVALMPPKRRGPERLP
jgi:hypothetical protein